MALIDNEKGRIETIDAFRFIAIFGVVIYHYFYRFSPPFAEINHYPYQYTPIWITQYGFYGVQLFFVISGFVISKTLEGSVSFSSYMAKRLIRLLPLLIICSILTFVVEVAHYSNGNFSNANQYLNFLPSLTFTSPEFWNFLLSTEKISYIDGVYWSLAVEMQFYIIVGAIYFWNPRNILFNWILITFLLTTLRVISSPKLHFLFSKEIIKILDGAYSIYFYLNLSYWFYFAMGIFFYRLYSKTKNIPYATTGLFSLLGVLELYFLGNNYLRIFLLLIIFIFLILIYCEHWLSLLNNRIILWIGTISYPIYLLHEDLGIIIMNETAEVLNQDSLNKFMPLVAMICILAVAHLLTKYIERPAVRYFKTKLQLSRKSIDRRDIA